MRGIVKSQNLYYKTIFESATPGQYSLQLLKESYIIEMYGAGGGWANSGWATDTFYHQTGAGGSGAGFKGFITLEPGTYVINIGGGGGNVDAPLNNAYGKAGGDTSLENKIIAHGGGGGRSPYMSTVRGGVGGSVEFIDLSIIEKVYFNLTGYTGSTSGGAYSWGPASVRGGVSVYDGTINGYGAGGGYPYNSVSGYCRIWELSDEDNYDFVIKDTTALLPYNKVNKKYYSIGENYGN